jgi:hypothetical protein
MANKSVYPETAKLEEFIATNPTEDLTAREAGEAMVETLNEYEHGTADASDLFADVGDSTLTSNAAALRAVRAVYEDLYLTLANR